MNIIGLIFGILVTYLSLLLLIRMLRETKEGTDNDVYPIANPIFGIVMGLMAFIASLISIIKG